MRRTDVVGICGTSYCGSTLVGFILGSLPGCVAVGEDHAVIRGRIARGAECSTCSPGTCPVWTPEFSKGYRYVDGWDRFAGLSGARTVIASDKVPSWYRPYLAAGWKDQFRPLVLWKSPAGFAASDHRHHGYSPEKSMDRWTRVYRGLFDLFDDYELDPVVVNFEDFAADPPNLLEAICDALDLPFDLGALEYWTRPHHQVCGNNGPQINIRGLDHPRSRAYFDKIGPAADIYRSNYRQIFPARPRDPSPPAKTLERLYDCDDVLDVYRRLGALSL